MSYLLVAAYYLNVSTHIDAASTTASLTPAGAVSKDIQQAIASATASVDESHSHSTTLPASQSASMTLHQQHFHQQAQQAHDPSHIPAASSVKSSSNNNNKADLTGYTFQWVRARLKAAIQSHLHLAFVLTLSPVLALDSALFLREDEALIALRKATNLPQTKTTRGGNTNAKKASSKHASKYAMAISYAQQHHGTIDALQQASYQYQALQQTSRRSSQRYSLLSRRNSAASSGIMGSTIAGSGSSAKTRSNSIRNRPNSILYNPLRDQTQQHRNVLNPTLAESHGIHGTSSLGAAGSSGGSQSNDAGAGGNSGGDSSNTTPSATSNAAAAAVANGELISGAHSLFTCPILGPILVRTCSWIWYDVEAVDAITNVCENVFSHGYEKNTSSSSRSGEHSASQSTALSFSGRNSFSLTLRSTDIGSYHLPPSTNIAIAPADNALAEENADGGKSPNATAGTTSATNKIAKRVSPAEQAAQALETTRRAIFYDTASSASSSSAPASRYQHTRFRLNILAESERTSVYVYARSSLLLSFGAFHHYAPLAASLPVLSASQLRSNGLIEALAHMMSEAKYLLPHLLAFPLPTDTLLLQASVYCIGAEEIAMRAAEGVRFAIQRGGMRLLRARSNIERLLLAFQEALYVLNHTEHLDAQILEHSGHLQSVARDISQEAEDLRVSLNQVSSI